MRFPNVLVKLVLLSIVAATAARANAAVVTDTEKAGEAPHLTALGTSLPHSAPLLSNPDTAPYTHLPFNAPAS